MTTPRELVRQVVDAAAVPGPEPRFPDFTRRRERTVERPPLTYAPDRDIARATFWRTRCAEGFCRYENADPKREPASVDTTSRCPGMLGVLHVGPPAVLRWRACDRKLAWMRRRATEPVTKNRLGKSWGANGGE